MSLGHYFVAVEVDCGSVFGINSIVLICFYVYWNISVHVHDNYISFAYAGFFIIIFGGILIR